MTDVLRKKKTINIDDLFKSKPGDGIDHVSDHDEAASKRINGK